MTWKFTKSILAAFIFSLIFYIVVPIVLLFVFLLLFTSAALMDPLNAGTHINGGWAGLGNFSIFLIILSVLVSPTVGILSTVLVNKIKSVWVYPIIGAISLFAHYVLAALIGGGVYLATKDEYLVSYGGVFMVILIILAPLMGILTAVLARPKLQTNDLQKNNWRTNK